MENPNDIDRPLRVFVDASVLKPELGGFKTYIVEAVRALAARPELQLTVATSVPDVFATVDSLDVIPIGPRSRTPLGRIVWRERHLPRLVERTASDVFYAPVAELPVRRIRRPTVIVVHDMTALIAPALWGWHQWLSYRLELKHACRRADGIVCVSNATLEGLYTHVGVDPRICRVIGEGARSLGEQRDTNGSGARADGDYVLYVGSMLGHKNVLTLVRAIAGDGPDGLPRLVIAGPLPPPHKAALEAELEALPNPDRVEHRGFVSDEELQALYNRALAFVFPTLTEGFGLPVLEAMDHGVPVLASDIPVVREVAGDAAAYVGASLQPESWADAIRSLAADGARRDELVSRGRERVQLYTWERVADELAALFADVASRRAP